MVYTTEERIAAKRASRTKWQRKNKARDYANKAAWVKANPDKLRQQQLRRRSKQKEYSAAYRLRTAYGLTRDDYDRIFQAQHGVCAVCERPDKKRRLAVDHCHSTRRVRGLLCSSCNRGIGLLQDNPSILVSAARYLHEAAAAQLDEMLS